MQPLDRGPFHSLKSWWNKGLYVKIHSIGGCKLTHAEWFQVFVPAYERATTVKNMQGGFRITGIYPTDHAVPLKELEKDLEQEEFDALIDYASDSKISLWVHFTLGACKMMMVMGMASLQIELIQDNSLNK